MQSRALILTVLTVLAGALYVNAGALPLNFNQLPEQFKEFVPEEVTKFYAELTEQEKTVLKEVAADHEKYVTEDDALKVLEGKSPKLHAKAVELRALVKAKINALKPEAKTFVDGIVEKLKALKPKANEKPNLTKLRDAANEVIAKYQALSQEAKDDLKTNFPKISNIVHNEKFQGLAKGLLKKEEQPAN